MRFLLETHSLVLLALSTLANLSSAQSTAKLNITFPAHPSNSSLVNVVKDNFLGISWELSSFNTLWGDSSNAIPPAMQNYLSNIKARISSPLRIRVGGNGMDASTYVPTQTDQMIRLTDPKAYFNDVPVDFGPVFFDVLNAMADRVGEMQFIIGLSMRDEDSWKNSIEVATDAEAKLGSRLDAMLLGNEPDLYAHHGERESYEISDYIPEVGNVFQQFEDAGLLNDTLIGGPTVCCSWDLDDVIEGGLDKYPYKYYTIQHYPTNICNGANAENSNISYFLAHTNVPNYIWWNNGNHEGIQIAKSSGVPLLLTEYNSVSCGGSNISDTFAMALWATDVALQAATTNFTAVYLHTREYAVTYNLFDPPSASTALESGWHTGAIYYTTLIVAESLSASGSVVKDLNIGSSGVAGIAGYAIWDNAGETRGKLVLINYASPDYPDPSDTSPATDTAHTFSLPANLTHAIGIRYLLAPSIYSGSSSKFSELASQDDVITWANQTIGEAGSLNGTQFTEFVRCRDGCDVTVPGPGLALVYLLSNVSDRFYEGNSSVVGPVLVGSAMGMRAVSDIWPVLWTLGVGFGLLGLLAAIMREGCD